MTLIINRASVMINRANISASIGNTSGGSGPILEFLDFPSATNWTNTGNIWNPTSYPPNGEGRTNKSIPAGQDGWIEAEYDSTTNESTAIILHTNNVNASPYYDTCLYGLYIAATGNYATAESGSYTEYVPALPGDLFRVNRVGTTVTAEYYRGGSWTNIYTYTTGEGGQLYLMASSADPGVSKSLRYPKGYNIS